MTVYDRLAAQASAISLQPEDTSYFSAPEDHLDPRLFDGEHLRPSIRSSLLHTLYAFWRRRYRAAESWSTVWLAGSGVSYQWSAARQPGDLDVLIGVNWVAFRRNNDDFQDLGDQELARYLNDELREDLWPQTANFKSAYEATWFINAKGEDIRTLRPYAAYDVTSDSWTVKPDRNPHHDVPDEWDSQVQQDFERAVDIVARYDRALDEVQSTVNPGLRLNATSTLRTAAMEGASLFDNIHEGRKHAFSPEGEGYSSAEEYRYKSAKGNGVMTGLRRMKDALSQAGLDIDDELYGGLPDARQSLILAATNRRYRG